jgi:hypothetical protein
MQVVTLLVLCLAQTVVVLPVGKSVPLKLHSGEPVREIWISDDRVVDVGGINLWYARGKAPGVSLVTLTGVRKGTRSVLVVVPKPTS